MALYFKTATPSSLLNTFKKAIDNGHVDTWSYDADGDFTHTPPQWKNLAWLRPKVLAGKLALFILKRKDVPLAREVYAVYHGRFAESMIAHCHSFFDEGSATALPDSGDVI